VEARWPPGSSEPVVTMKYIATVEGQEFTIEIVGPSQILINGQPVSVDLQRVGRLTLYSLLLDQRSFEIVIEEGGQRTWHAILGGRLFEVCVEDERTRRLAKVDRGLKPPSGELPIRAPIPGLVVKVLISPGERVQAGRSLIILEAMKMENEIRAPRAGIVHEVRTAPGDTVKQGQILVTLR
jgi:biotin carboxyl carrier protein